MGLNKPCSLRSDLPSLICKLVEMGVSIEFGVDDFEEPCVSYNYFDNDLKERVGSHIHLDFDWIRGSDGANTNLMAKIAASILERAKTRADKNWIPK